MLNTFAEQSDETTLAVNQTHDDSTPPVNQPENIVRTRDNNGAVNQSEIYNFSDDDDVSLSDIDQLLSQHG